VPWGAGTHGWRRPGLVTPDKVGATGLATSPRHSLLYGPCQAGVRQPRYAPVATLGARCRRGCRTEADLGAGGAVGIRVPMWMWHWPQARSRHGGASAARRSSTRWCLGERMEGECSVSLRGRLCELAESPQVEALRLDSAPAICGPKPSRPTGEPALVTAGRRPSLPPPPHGRHTSVETVRGGATEGGR
jgi:hypothetical protein